MIQLKDSDYIVPIPFNPDPQFGEGFRVEAVHVSADENPRWVVTNTAYNSLPDQTWGNPHETATGTETQSGIVAISRDLLPDIPHGSVIRFVEIGQFEETPNGCGATMKTILRRDTLPGLPSGHFRVEDTLGAQSVLGVDIWLEYLDDALRWGTCQAEIELVAHPESL